MMGMRQSRKASSVPVDTYWGFPEGPRLMFLEVELFCKQRKKNISQHWQAGYNYDLIQQIKIVWQFSFTF